MTRGGASSAPSPREAVTDRLHKLIGVLHRHGYVELASAVQDAVVMLDNAEDEIGKLERDLLTEIEAHRDTLNLFGKTAAELVTARATISTLEKKLGAAL